MLHQLAEQLNKTWPISVWGQTRVLLAVSGGADSVAMLRALLEMVDQQPRAQRLIDVAHFNHGWRGAESDSDEAFVRELCQTLELRLFVGRATATTQQPSDQPRSEESARHARYAFLASTAYACGARYVATAHTASDRVETLLHNLFRGTGLAGAAAPQLSRDLDQDLVLVRPLIRCSRDQITDYLSTCHQAYREDSSNDDTSYRRNYIRRVVLPQLRGQYGEHLDSHLLSFSELVEESLQLQQELAGKYLQSVDHWLAREPIRWGAGSMVVPTLERMPAPWPIVREALKQLWAARGWPLGTLTRWHWEALRRLLAGELKSLNLPGGVTAKYCLDYIEIYRIVDEHNPPSEKKLPGMDSNHE